MNEFKIDIEETQKFVELGVICITNGTRKRYFKVGEMDKDGNTSLIPLSNSELKNLGIEESAQGESQDQELDIEESEGETETERQFREEKEKANVILKGTPEAVKKAKELLQNASELEEKNEDLTAKLELQAQLAFERKKKELGCSDSEIDTPDKLFAWEKGKSGSGSPSGSAPLQSNYFDQFEKSNADLLKKIYPDSKSMISDVRSRARMGDQTAQKVLEKWMQNYLENKKRNPQTADVIYDPNSKEALEELNLKRVGEWLIREDSDPFDLKKNFRERNKKRLKGEA